MTGFGQAWRGAVMLGGVLIGAPVSAWAEDAPIGFVKSASGWVMITHGQLTYAAREGSAVYKGDTLETSVLGAMGVTFKDDTRISLGPFSHVTIENFVFAPAQHQYGFVLRLLTGTMQYISGLTARLAPDSMQVETPTATVAVRGTRFLARVE